MKRICSIFLTIILTVSMICAASAAGYTLPEKMERQLQVGSGLKGSFVIHANADAELSPLIHAIQNAEFEIRGIQYEGNKHYYIYQAGENEAMNALTEYCTNEGKEYLRSDFLEDGCYQLPTIDHLINAWLKSEGDNPSIFPDLLRMILAGESEEISTEGLERQAEVWISSFSTESTVQSGEGLPRLSQTFKIPVEELYNAVTALIRTISSDETYMSYFRETLSKEQIDTYLNPNLGYYYTEAMKQLDMSEDILFTRTVSTLGELIQSKLILPLDPGKTGYSSITLESSDTNKSFYLTGPRGILYLNLPAEFDLNEDQIKDAEIHFALIDNENEKSKNMALKIILSKENEKNEDAEDGRNHTKEIYKMNITRSLEGLPEEITEELIPDIAAADAEAVIHWSSKSQLSSPTSLEISCKIIQGRFNFELEANLKTSSPWIFAPFAVDNARNLESYEISDLEELKDAWIKNADGKIAQVSETTDPEGTEKTAEAPLIPEEEKENGDAEPIEEINPEAEDNDPIG